MSEAGRYNYTPQKEYQVYNNIRDAIWTADATQVWQVVYLLRAGFCKLPNLRAIKFVIDLIGRSGWFKEYPLLNAVHERDSMMSHGLVLHWQKHIVVRNSINWTDMCAVVHAIRSSRIRIREFTIYEKADDGNADMRLTPAAPGQIYLLHTKDRMHYKDFFSNLTSLSLVIDSMYCSACQVPELLCAAKLLEHLGLDCKRQVKYGEPIWVSATDAIECAFVLRRSWEKDKIYNPVQAVVLPRLRTLSLSNFSTNGWALNKTLGYHRKTLKSFTLRNVNHKSSKSLEMWEAILDTIKSLDLKSVVLENVSGFVRDVPEMDTVSAEPRRGLNDQSAGIPKTQETSNQEALTLWDMTNFWVGKMPQDILREELHDTGLQIDNFIDHRPLRDHIRRIQRKLDPLIMAYIDGKSELNPLVGREMCEQIDWDMMDHKWDHIK